MKREDPREWEHYCIIVGACLGGKAAQEKVFATISPSDCPYPQLARMLEALKSGNRDEIKAATAGVYHLHGVKQDGGTLQGIVERVKETAAKRKRIEEAKRVLREAMG